MQSSSYAVREWNASWFVNDIDEPYVDESDPKFLWVRPRLVGGRTNVWGREWLRISDIEFKAASHDGPGVDWPIGYTDVEPYYDLVEDYIGVQGMTEGLPGLPDGRFQPAMALTCAETALRTRIKKAFGRTLTQGRTANLTRPTHGRQPCHFCGPCEHGCVTHSYFNASFTTMADAIATGRCTLITGAMVYKVLVDPDTRRARGVLYIDRATRQPREILGRVVALCAQTQESMRILFNSATRQDPNGLANSSGLLGKGLMTHFSDSGATGELPEFSEKPTAGGPRRPCWPLMVRFRNLPGGPQQKDFLRGYAFGVYVGTGLNLGAPGYGQAFKSAAMEPQPANVSMSGFGECLRYEDNYVTVDPNTRGRLRHPRPEDSPHAAREREGDAGRHGRHRRGDARSRRRQEHPADPRRARQRPRARRGAHGDRPEDVGAHALPADARHPEPVRDGRLRLRVERLAEPDADDHGAGRAVVRIPQGAAEAGRALGAHFVRAGRRSLTLATGARPYGPRGASLPLGGSWPN